MSFIEAQDLLSFVDGTGKEPKDFLETDDKGEIMNPEYVTWRRTDRLFKIKMIGTMTEDVLSPTTRLRTSCNIWMCLEKTFAQSSKDRELQLQCQLQLCRKGFQTCLCSKLKTICDDLTAIQKPVSDSDKVFVLAL